MAKIKIKSEKINPFEDIFCEHDFSSQTVAYGRVTHRGSGSVSLVSWTCSAQMKRGGVGLEGVGPDSVFVDSSS